MATTRRSLSEVDERLTTEILNRDKVVKTETARALVAEKALADRIAALEGITPQGPPVVIPPVTPPTTDPLPAGPITLQSGKTYENLVIDQKPNGTLTFDEQFNGGKSITGIGVKNVTIKNVTIRGRYWGIFLVDCDDVTIENVIVTDVDYAGIAVFGGNRVKILNPTVQRIGTLRSDPASHPQLDNAYGFFFGSASANHGINGSGNTNTDCLVSGGTCTDSPLWMLVNAHEATRLTVEGMFLRRAPRAVFMAGQIIDCIVRNNDIAIPVTGPGSPHGSSDVESVLYSGWTRGSITGNKIGAPYPMPSPYGSNNGVTVSGNVRV